MDHPGERRERGVHAREHRVEGGQVGHVGDFHFDVDAAPGQLCQGRLSLGIGIPPTVEHDGLGPSVHEPVGDRQTDSAQAAGD